VGSEAQREASPSICPRHVNLAAMMMTIRIFNYCFIAELTNEILDHFIRKQ